MLLKKMMVQLLPTSLVFIFSICLVCSWKESLSDNDAISIAAFNIRVFGRSKMEKNVSHHIVNIILRYDLILVQEIRDSKGDAIRHLFKDVQQRGALLDQKEDKIKLLSAYTYDDKDDVFEREPFIAHFSAPTAAVQNFVVAGIHISPKHAAKEISNLTAVYDEITEKFKSDDVIIMGDFNAGCDYLKEWSNITLAKDDRFFWLIDNSVDTTSEVSDCPYDRIVVSGENLIKAIITESPRTFMYDKEFELDKNKALEISDHYPVEMKLRLKDENELTDVQSRKIIYDKRVDDYVRDNVYQIYQMRLRAIRIGKYEVREKFTKSGAYLQIVVSKTNFNASETLGLLNKFKSDFPRFITSSQTAIAKRYFKKASLFEDLPDGHGNYKTLKDYYLTKTRKYILELVCNLRNKQNLKCGFQIFAK